MAEVAKGGRSSRSVEKAKAPKADLAVTGIYDLPSGWRTDAGTVESLQLANELVFRSAPGERPGAKGAKVNLKTVA